MRKRSVLLGLLLVLTVGVLPAAAITWGEPDTEHTNVGAMVVDWPGYGPWQWCTGTLIHPRVFLTAGHCTADLDAYGIETVWVNFDEYAVNEKTLLDVEQVITHPDYYWGPTSDPHDVGVLILKKPVKKLKPANLPEEGFLDQLLAEGKLRQGSDEVKFTLVGYGGSLDWPPPDIYYEDYRQAAESEYQALLKAWLRMSQNQATGDGGTCFGDSGGPAFWTEPDGTEILVGITSWGDANCVATGFNYRVDIPETLDFINDVIASLE
jgi:secreted trypsin-like serine protease